MLKLYQWFRYFRYILLVKKIRRFENKLEDLMKRLQQYSINDYVSPFLMDYLLSDPKTRELSERQLQQCQEYKAYLNSYGSNDYKAYVAYLSNKAK